ncbi:MAG: hypothetical protein WCK32_05930 [Chlorobiaceae bacterium]
MLNHILIRLSDLSKAPFCWWYSLSSSNSALAPTVEIRELHAHCSETINKTMLTLLSVGLYCLLTVIGTPDKALIMPNSIIQTPLVGTFQYLFLVF